MGRRTDLIDNQYNNHDKLAFDLFNRVDRQQRDHAFYFVSDGQHDRKQLDPAFFFAGGIFHGHQLDCAERFFYEQLPRRHGSSHQRERDGIDEHDDFNAEHVFEHHVPELEQQHFSEFEQRQLDELNAEFEQQHLAQQLFDDCFDLDQHQHDSGNVEHCKCGLRSCQRVGRSAVFEYRQFDRHYRHEQQQRDDDSGLHLQRRDHYSERHGDDPEFAVHAEYQHAEQLDDSVDQPSVSYRERGDALAGVPRTLLQGTPPGA